MDSREGTWFSYTPLERDPAEVQAEWDALWPDPVPAGGPLNRFSVLRYYVAADEEEPFFAALDLVVPVVDGTPLYELLGGGRCAGIPEEWMEPPYRQWLGAPEHIEYGRPIVLDGTCGSAGCCGVMARISVLADTVIWDQFHGHGGTSPADTLRFEFDRADYEAQLERLPHTPATEWDGE